MQENNTWWDKLYDELVGTVFLERPPQQLQEQVNLLKKLLQLPNAGLVFDQCCGLGTLSIPLAREGFGVIGVDWSAAYIEQAKRETAALNARWFAGDAFVFEPDTPCDAAFNWGTSFGNHREDASNLKMLQRAFAALKPGGRFLLEFPNMVQLLQNFQSCLIRKKQTDAGEIKVIRECWLDLAGGCLLQEWTILTGYGHETRPTCVRLYMPDQLLAMMASVGFHQLQLLDGSSGMPLQAHHARCLVVGRRP